MTNVSLGQLLRFVIPFNIFPSMTTILKYGPAMLGNVPVSLFSESSIIFSESNGRAGTLPTRLFRGSIRYSSFDSRDRHAGRGPLSPELPLFPLIRMIVRFEQAHSESGSTDFNGMSSISSLQRFGGHTDDSPCKDQSQSVTSRA